MSIPLPQINLSGAVVGTTGNVSLQNIGIGAGGVTTNPANTLNTGILHFFNESGCGLQISFNTGGSFYLPAGAWVDKRLNMGEQSFSYNVIYLLSFAPVSTLLVTYYAPNENIPSIPILGNSPIAGSTNTMSGNITFLATPFLLINNVTIVNGTPQNFSCTGVGGIPASATGVLISIYYGGVGSSAGSFLTFVPQGATWLQANYPILGAIQVNGGIVQGILIMPVNTANGGITIAANNSNVSGINAQIYGYIG